MNNRGRRRSTFIRPNHESSRVKMSPGRPKNSTRTWLLALLGLSLAGVSTVQAEDHNFDMGIGADPGVASAWDSESVNPLSGNLHLSIPLYTFGSGADFSVPLTLEYNSTVWDPVDINYASFNGAPPFRGLMGRSSSGLGWRLSIPRVMQLSVYSATSTVTQYYYQSGDGGLHPLYRSRCDGVHRYMSFDGSGVQADFAPDPADPTYPLAWTVWTPDGTKLVLNHRRNPELDRRPGVLGIGSWYPTGIESAARKNDAAHSAAHWVTIVWQDPNISHDSGDYGRFQRWFCPQSMSDDLSHTVSFTCESSPFPVDTGLGDYDYYFQNGGRVSEIDVPGPQGHTIVYQFTHQYRNLSDPFTTMPCSSDCPPVVLKYGVPVLTALGAYESQNGEEGGPPFTALPVQFVFDYNGAGILRQVTEPGGATRTYGYGYGRIWRADPPNLGSGTATNGQFAYFPTYSLRSRTLTVDGRTWGWQYQKSNANCTENAPASCYDNPNRVIATGPGDPEDLSVDRSVTVFNYEATTASGSVASGGSQTAGTPSDRDGTLRNIQVYAGDVGTGKLLRTISYVYDYDNPDNRNGACAREWRHHADNVRVKKTTTTFEDDPNAVHDMRVSEVTGWTILTPNILAPTQTTEYLADGVSPYRIRKQTYVTLTNVNLAEMPRIQTSQLLDGSGTTVMSETDWTYNTDGRPASERRLYAPTVTPAGISPDDLVTTIGYDPNTGYPTQISRGTGASPNAYVESLGWDTYGHLTTRGSPSLDWNAYDVTSDPNTGLVTDEQRPWGGGGHYTYDALGRVQTITGVGDPPVSLTYSGNQTTTTIGVSGSPQSIQKIALTDGMGQVKEERILRYDDSMNDRWVRRTTIRDWAGEPTSVSEWAPLTATDVPTTRIQRYGYYGASGGGVGIEGFDPGILAVDPFHRVRTRIGPDGAEQQINYLGLATLTTSYGVQGGSTSNPTPLNLTTTVLSDIFGRTVITQPPGDAAIATSVYDIADELVHVTRADRVNGAVAQQSTYSFDKLGRMMVLNEPERGKIWFGTHSGDTVQPDGYDPVGYLLRYQDASGAADPSAYYYREAYDAAGRITNIYQDITAGTPTTKHIASFDYDLSDHGNAASYLGRLGRKTSFDDSGNMESQTDYFYQDASGRLNKFTTVFGAWNTPLSAFYSYDSMGMVSALTYPTTGAEGGSNSTYLTFQYTHGLLDYVNSNQSTTIVRNIYYNDAGGMKKWIAGNNVRTETIPDDHVASRVKQCKVTTQAGSLLWDSGTYTFDGAGNVATIGADVFTYDTVGRLSEGFLSGTSANTTYRQYYAYDVFGNLNGKSLSVNGGVPDGASFNVETSTGRVLGSGTNTNWSYLPNGALSHDDSFNYGYDIAGRLSEIQVAGTTIGKYAYDAGGIRVYRREEHAKEIFYFRDPAGALLSQYSRPSASTGTPQWDRDFVYLRRTAVSMIENPIPAGPAWKVTSATSSSVTMNWFAPYDTDLFGYVVYRKGPGETDFAPLYATGSAVTTTGLSYTDSAVSSGQTYTYHVATVDTAGNQGPNSADRIITPGDSTGPAAPTNLSATAGNAVVSLNWATITPPADFAGYNVYRRVSNGTYGSARNSYPLSSHSYVDLAVTNGTTYYYIVKSVDTEGNVSVASNEVSAMPKLLQQGSWAPPDQDDEVLTCAQGPASDYEGDMPLAPYRVAGVAGVSTIFYLHSDHLGSLRLVTDASGAIVTNHKYLPYGEEVQPLATRVPFMYAGYEHDSESQHAYVGSRYLASATGRWLSPDPIGQGFPYAADSPINNIDPTGLAHVECVRNRTCIRNPDGTLTCTKWVEIGCSLQADMDDIEEALEEGLREVGSIHLPAMNWQGTRLSPCSGKGSSTTLADYAAGVESAGLMLGEFLSGLGRETSTYGPNSVESGMLESSVGVTNAVNSYLTTGQTSGTFEFTPPLRVAEAGINPMQQFVGSFNWKIAPTVGGLNITLTNRTSVWSASYHERHSHDRSTLRPGGNTYQTYEVFVPCGN